MGKALERSTTAALEAVRAEAAAAQEFMEASRSEATRRAYRSDWAIFTACASEKGLSVLPACASHGGFC